MSGKSVSLLNIFVFNAAFGDREDEEFDKIFYYYPEETDLNSKIQCVGLCEAVIKFTETFGSSACEALHTQKTKQIFLEPEPGFWMVMTLNVPTQQKIRDGQTYTEFYSDEIQDHVYQSLLLKCYRMFTLMNGTFENFICNKKDGAPLLKRTLSHFFDSYVLNIKSNDADLLDIFQGIHFLPLERYSFLKILCFINQIEEKFSYIKYSIFLYNDQLVWSGLEPEDMQVLYQHLSLDLIPSFIDSELKGGVYSPSRISPMGSGVHFGRFMTGPKSADDISGLSSTPKIFLNSGKTSCHLIAYRALNATYCLLLDESTILNLDLFKNLDAEIGPQLSSLASEIGEQYSKSPHINSEQAKFMYMYFNHMNLAEKTTMHSDMKRNGHPLVSSDIMKLFADVYSDLSKMKDFGEIIGKTVNDCWIVGKMSDERELYVVLQQKNANIVDVNGKCIFNGWIMLITRCGYLYVKINLKYRRYCSKEIELGKMDESALKFHMKGKKHSSLVKFTSSVSIEVQSFFKAVTKRNLPEVANEISASNENAVTQKSQWFFMHKHFIIKHSVLDAEIRCAAKCVRTSHYSYNCKEINNVFKEMCFAIQKLTSSLHMWTY